MKKNRSKTQDKWELSTINIAVKFLREEEKDGKKTGEYVKFPLFLACPANVNIDRVAKDFEKFVILSDDDVFYAYINRLATGERFAPLPEHPTVVVNSDSSYWVHQMNHLVRAGWMTEEQKTAAIEENKYNWNIPTEGELMVLISADDDDIKL